jgi:predicted membrane protein
MDCDLPFHDSPSDQARVKIVCRTVSGDVRIEAAAS